MKEDNKLRDQRIANVEQGVQTINESLAKIPELLLEQLLKFEELQKNTTNKE